MMTISRSIPRRIRSACSSRPWIDLREFTRAVFDTIFIAAYSPVFEWLCDPSPPTPSSQLPQPQYPDDNYPEAPQNRGTAPFSILSGLFDKLQNERKPDKRKKFMSAWFYVRPMLSFGKPICSGASYV